MVALQMDRALALCPEIDVGDPELLRNPTPSPRLVISAPEPESVLFARNVKAFSQITIEGTDSAVYVGESTRLLGTKIFITGDRARVIIGPRARLKTGEIHVQADDGLVVIGAKTTWESGRILCDRGKAVIIGNDCMFSNRVMIRTSDGHGIWDNKTGALLNAAADVFIDHHVWLGNSARVNKGTRIGMGAVLAQCAVASGDLAPECVHAGIPARVIKEDIHWTRRVAIDEIPDQYRLPRGEWDQAE
ncbi:acetyltransferase-like isoleucine patch superfamily enzyme [Sphingobium xenophagum]|uniref:Acetyltransferase-like isoleucine patch superfamily enzyme n=1 Tax=Sphingobium xenophagum TaxID=121428 RepID=A0ABU1X1I6_SPHXE|nr:hypothetical protein [Sphingobium xenophagum]MDR7155453.1 acetyltransferase-like isoleucine patch superfamily enzyme [Sphingobium xenophagum]